MTVIRYGAKAGAVLFMLGLWAGGAPTGLAAADDTGMADAAAPVAASAKPAAGESRSGRLGRRAAAASGGAAARRGAGRSNGAGAAAAEFNTRTAARPAPASARRPLSVRAVPTSATAAATPVPAVKSAVPSAPSARAVQRATVTAVTRVAADVSVAPPADASQGIVNSAVRQLFNTLINFAQTLPPGGVASFLEGALMMLRRSFFNEAPRVTPSPLTTGQDGKIEGRIGAFDLEGDALSYTVSSDPTHGTVTVDGTGFYSYTPGSDYGGLDSFTVRIAPQSRSLNILDPAADGSRDVTIKIGSGTNVVDNPDIAVNLRDTAGQITIGRNLFGQLTGAVTLTNLTDDTQGVWLNTAGGFGGVTIKQLVANYPGFKAKAAENGTTVDLHLSFIDADEIQKALVLNNVELSRNSDGSYQAIGSVAPSPAIEKTAVDEWDVTGKAFKALYDTFLADYKLDPDQSLNFRPVKLNFAGADLYLDTITPLSYQQSGLYAQDTESNPASAPSSSAAPGLPLSARPKATPSSSAAPALATLASAPEASINAAREPAAVSSTLAVGQSVYIGRKDGTVEVWTGGQKRVLADLVPGKDSLGNPILEGPWGKSGDANVGVTSLVGIDRRLLDKSGNELPNTFTGYIRGDVLTVTGVGFASEVVIGAELIAPGVSAGTIVTAFIPRNVEPSECSDKNTCETVAAGGVAGLTGTYQLSKSQSQPVGDDRTAQGVDVPPAGVGFTQKTLSGDQIAAHTAAVIVGLDNGAIEMYSPSVSAQGIGSGGWTELHGYQADWGKVTAMIPYLDGFVVGTDNGVVRQWTGPDGTAPSEWANAAHWVELSRNATNNPPSVTTLMPWKDRTGVDGFVVGGSDGSVLYCTTTPNGDPTWKTLFDGAQNSPVVGIVEYNTLNNGLPSFAFALQNGYVGAWKEKAVDTGFGPRAVVAMLVDKGWATITSMAGVGRNFLVGTSNSSIQFRDATTNQWIQLNSWGADTSKPVTKIIPFQSDGLTAPGQQGAIIGFGNGAISAWTGYTPQQGGLPVFTELHSAAWRSAVTSLTPITGSAITLSGDAVIRDGLIVGLSNGAVEQWSGKVSKGKADGWISDGDQPAMFSGSISDYYNGTLTVDSVTSGDIKAGFWFNAKNALFQIADSISGNGGAGTYSLIGGGPYAKGAFTDATAGRSGRTLVVDLPAAYRSGGELNPADLVGSTVTGVGVKSGTTITAFVGYSGSLAKFTLSDSSLVADEPLAISGLGTNGERDWIQLQTGAARGASQALGKVPTLADFTCDASTWKCGQSGILHDAVEFAKNLDQPVWEGGVAQFGTQAGGIGSSSDPIFGQNTLKPGADGGQVIAFHFSKEFSPDALNYTLGGSDPINFKGSVSVSTSCGVGGPAKCGILEVKDGSVTTGGKAVNLDAIKPGMTLEPGTFYRFAGLKSTTIGDPVPNKPGQFYIGGFVPDTDLATEIDVRLADMSVAETAPDLQVGLDVNPLGYGYMVIPDGFFPKFKPSRWSIGMLLAAEIGPSLEVRTAKDGPEKDLSLASITAPGPLGFDTIEFDTGAKLGVTAKVNGLEKDSASAYAYAVPGMLFTLNTKDTDGVDTAFNYYLLADASDFKNSTGVTAEATLTPYVSILYGVLIPKRYWLVGGWSLFTVSAGFENPINASFCADRAKKCPTADADTGSTASLSFSASGALTFHAGLLDGITTALSYDKDVPLYQTSRYTTVLV